MADANMAIQNSTLSDDASVAVLSRCQSRFLTDGDVADNLRLQGEVIFHGALFTAIPAALQANQQIVGILRQTLQAISSLYLQNEQRKAVSSKVDGGGNVAWRSKDLDMDSEATTTTPPVQPQEPISSEEHDNMSILEPHGLSAAIKAQKKHCPATHSTKGRNTAAAGVVKATKRTSRVSKPTPKASALADLQNKMNPNPPTIAKLAPSCQARKPRVKKSHWSLFVKLKVPEEFLVQLNPAAEEEMPANTRAKTRAKSKTVKSDEFVTSDVEDADEAAPRRSPRTKKSASTKPSYALSSVEEEMEGEDEDEDEYEEEEMFDVDDTAPQSTKTSTSTSCSRSKSSTPQENNETEDQDQETTATSPSPLPSNNPHTYPWPPFPLLPALHYPPFHLGATIALSNLREDASSNPSSSLLDLITELEENRPSVTGWEMNARLAGGEWVYQSLREYVEEDEKRDVVRKRIFDVVNALEGWEKREWEKKDGNGDEG
ncbi:hypothetical protein CC86DRAFT_403672 [Ophiobolus disseminans]|uniref:Uncharacterized protein n=1 Tax=Ophiobolus disseminans TaxID=1469910 RepID=A0A6A7A6W9_9PLEO|nr:hypothetical protein CC86DRAFT_403672 [Ophiobolus disseminans]